MILSLHFVLKVIMKTLNGRKPKPGISVLDYGFLKDRIYGSLDFYQRNTKDLLSWVPVPAGSNLSNYINQNIGELENKGFEFSICSKSNCKKLIYPGISDLI